MTLAQLSEKWPNTNYPMQLRVMMNFRGLVTGVLLSLCIFQFAFGQRSRRDLLLGNGISLSEVELLSEDSLLCGKEQTSDQWLSGAIGPNGNFFDFLEQSRLYAA